MNQRNFAEITGLSESFVSRWIRGERRIGYDTAKRLSEEFGRSVEFFAESEPERVVSFIKRITPK